MCLFQLVMMHPMTQVCVLERVVWNRRGPIISALMQQLEINKYRALGLSTFPYPQQLFGLVHEGQLALCPCPRIYNTVQYYKMIQTEMSFLMRQGVVLAGAPYTPVPGFKVAPKMMRLRHQIQPVPPHPE